MSVTALLAPGAYETAVDPQSNPSAINAEKRSPRSKTSQRLATGADSAKDADRVRVVEEIKMGNTQNLVTSPASCRRDAKRQTVSDPNVTVSTPKARRKWAVRPLPGTIYRQYKAEIEARARAASWPGLPKEQIQGLYASNFRGLTHWELPPLDTTEGHGRDCASFVAWESGLTESHYSVRGFLGDFFDGDLQGCMTFSVAPLYLPVDGVTKWHRAFAKGQEITPDHPLHARILDHFAGWGYREYGSKAPIAQIRAFLRQVEEPVEPIDHQALGFPEHLNVHGDDMRGTGFFAPGWRGDIFVFRDLIPNDDGKFTRVWFGEIDNPKGAVSTHNPKGLVI